MASIGRAFRATGIVALLGAFGGALGGVALGFGILVWDVIGRGHSLQPEGIGMITLMTVGVGSAYGMVLGPLFAWTMLRRAPLWRAIMEPAAAAAITVVTMLPLKSGAVGLFLLPVLVSAAAAFRLRFAVDRRLRLRNRAESASSLLP